MVELFTILTSIGLLDSTSIIPLCIITLVALLAGPNPVFKSFSLILGIFAVYFACGFLILLGLQSAFDDIHAYAVRLWKAPVNEELIFQILVGVMLCVFGLRIFKSRKKRAENPVVSSMTAVQAVLAGAGISFFGLPGALPYLAAIDLMLRAELPLTQRILVLGYYNIVFVAPLAAIVVLRLAFGDRSQNILDAVKRFFDRWGQRVIVVLLLTLGVVLIVDGVGWFFGYPLIPV